MSESLSVSVLIATLDRSAVVCDTIRALATQLYIPKQVIIVEQGETSREVEDTLTTTWADAGVLLGDAGLGASGARMTGLAHATGDLILCLDDDVIIDDPGFIAAHVRCYRDQHIGAVCGRAIELGDRAAPLRSSIPPRVLMPICQVYGSADCIKRTYCSCLKGANMSIRRSVLEQVGGFDLGLGATYMHEDTDLALRIIRAGHGILFEPAACLIHIAAKRGGGRHHVTATTSARYLAFRDKVLLFRKHAPAWTVPLFLTWNSIMAARPLLRGDVRSCVEALRGLGEGFSTYAHLKRWHQNQVIGRINGE